MKILHKLIAICLSALALSACTRQGIVQTEESPQDISNVPESATPGRLVIKINEQFRDSDAVFQELQASGIYELQRVFPHSGKHESLHRKHGLDLWYVVTFEQDRPLTRAHSDLSSIKGVESIEFDYMIKPNALPFNDPRLDDQWHYHNDGSKSGTMAGSDMRVFDAWKLTTGSPDVIVAVCDQGVDYNHEDLAANMWKNIAELNGEKGVDDDNNGYVDDINGYNFVAQGGSNSMVGAISPGDHGTHVAGTIAAVNNNGKGVSGIAGGNGSPESGVRIMGVQTMDGSAYISAAIVYAADNGAVLMNCSWELPDASRTPDYLVQAFRYFNQTAGMDSSGTIQTGPMAGGLIIFAAGNNNDTKGFPASEDDVVAIASIGADYCKAYYSNFGSWVDFTATGGDAQKGYNILSTVVDGYGYLQGTSMAAPHATGSAALAVSMFKGEGFTREHLIHILKSTADPVIYDYNGAYKGMLGYGLIDTYAAVSFQDKAPAKVSQFSGKAKANEVTLKWTVPGETSAKEFHIFVSNSSLKNIDPANPGYGVQTHKISASEHRPGTELSYVIGDLDWNADYCFAIASMNLSGAFSELSDELKFTIYPNQAPKIEALTPTDITIKAHESSSIRLKISDPEESPLSYTLSPEQTGITHYRSGDIVTVEINALAMQDSQSYTCTLTVSDGQQQASEEIRVQILANNSPEPTAAIPDMVLNSLKDEQDIDMSKHFTDKDGEQLKYSYRLNPSATIVKASAEADIFRVSAYSYGSCVMTVTATDACGKSSSSSFRLLVRDGNVPLDVYPNPVTDKLNIRTAEDAEVSVRIVNKVGAQVYSAESVTTGPFAPFSFEMSSQPAGEYYVSISGQEMEERVTVIKK